MGGQIMAAQDLSRPTSHIIIVIRDALRWDRGFGAMAAFFAGRTAVISACGIRLCMAFFPKPLGDVERVDSKIVPPRDFTASLV